ncbi:MAG: acyl-CoA thioesterase [Gammaproteobacteria bacterium]
MVFSEVLESLHAADGGWQAKIPDDWLQGRTAFGGLQAALAVSALRRLLPGAPPLRVLQTTFIAPVPAGPVRMTARILRTGKSAVHGECRITDGEQTLCLAVAVFGSARPSSLRIAPARPDAPSAESVRAMPFVDGITPAFVRHFDFHWVRGTVPFTGASEPRTSIHVRHHEPQALDERHLIAFADTVPSPGISMLRAPAQASSLTWTLELVGHRCDFAPTAFWRMDTEVTAGGDGYYAQSALLWNPDGGLAALSRQSVVIFG